MGSLSRAKQRGDTVRDTVEHDSTELSNIAHGNTNADVGHDDAVLSGAQMLVRFYPLLPAKTTKMQTTTQQQPPTRGRLRIPSCHTLEYSQQVRLPQQRASPFL
jgi:hypothetical protein